MSSESNSTWTFSQSFTASFQASRTELHSRIAAFAATPPTAADVEDLAARLAKLSKALSDASASLPTYDQKLYTTQIKNLEKDIDAFRTAAKPKTRFAFKRKAPTVAAATAPPPIESASPLPLAPPITSSHDTGPGPAEATTGTAPLPPPDSAMLPKGLELSEHSHRYLSWPDLPSAVSPGSAPDLAISKLSRCIVNLLPTTEYPSRFSALHIRNLSDCVLLLPFNEGSALIHDIKNCVLVLGCHQFRMHTSTNVDVYLRIASNPIIETCHGIRFATYPSRLAPQLLQEPPQPPFTVQDFSHIRATRSPNFELVGQKLWNETRPWPTERISDKDELANVLIAFLPETTSTS
ncbi:tubulin binding cofactor C-domain-containing protein [Ephemerocybe angulata]|uniref:Tubulin binding cofactor C-domain-containing protein n=1 Tax=Ephemerocybe angulata TaxID=980116 RepID=A0A8H6HKH1_9AGAR|nr:tubulin binding cofactor C-domain-containing protein [Tulosesus angulatus]